MFLTLNLSLWLATMGRRDSVATFSPVNPTTTTEKISNGHFYKAITRETRHRKYYHSDHQYLSVRPRLAVQRLWQVLSLKEVQPHPDKNIWLQLTKFKWTNSNHKLQHLWRTCILGGYLSGQKEPFLWAAPRGCSSVPVKGVIIWS